MNVTSRYADLARCYEVTDKECGIDSEEIEFMMALGAAGINARASRDALPQRGDE
jgi:hypothetical protein